VHHCNQWGLYGVRACATAPRRCPFHKLLWANLLISISRVRFPFSLPASFLNHDSFSVASIILICIFFFSNIQWWSSLKITDCCEPALLQFVALDSILYIIYLHIRLFTFAFTFTFICTLATARESRPEDSMYGKLTAWLLLVISP